MRVPILKYWDRLRTSFWFLPSVMVVVTVPLALATVALDRRLSERSLRGWDWIYSGSAEGASTVLGTIAGSMITLAGVVFSLTLVALTLASSQFGPRLMRNFMRDTANQVVIGTFVSTFLYCLLLLRTVRREDESGSTFVPHVGVTLGGLLAVASLGVLIYFIHHVSVSIQADEIVGRVAEELRRKIDQLFPEQIGDEAPGRSHENGERLPEAFDREASVVRGVKDGYLQLVDGEELLALAVEEDLLLELLRRPGDFVSAGAVLARVWPGERATAGTAERIREAFVLGNQRTSEQDVEYLLNQIVEIAVRALSPGINDPFTAVSCVNRLGSALTRLSRRRMPSPWRSDDRGRPRVVAPAASFPGFLDAAFGEIRMHATSSAAVSVRLMEVIAQIAEAARQPQDRVALQRHADAILRATRDGLSQPEDRRRVEDVHREVARTLAMPAAATVR